MSLSERKVLIITYYWPPSGGSGVQRWLKFVKYLPHFGWTPYVFTPENPSFDIRDESLLSDVPQEAEVIRLPIWEPYDAFRKLTKFFTGKTKSSKPGDFVSASDRSLFPKISTWIRGNFFIPDPKIFWVRSSVNFLHDFLREQEIRTVITTGPPHSMHLIGKRLKRKNPSLHWIADFRDPWSEWGFLDSLHTGVLAKMIHRRLERGVLQQADEVVTITPFYVRQFEKLGNRKVNLLTNGFDEDDFENFSTRKADKFYIRHIGTVNEKCDPRPFMKACVMLCEQNPEVKKHLVIEFVGEVHAAFKEFVLADDAMAAITTFTKSVSHAELMNIYASSSVLVLILTGYKDAEGYMPGKLFEYFATGLPVLGVGPVDGDAARAIHDAQAGVMVGEDDYYSIEKFLGESFLKWKTQSGILSREVITKYSRRGITKDLINLLK